MMPTRREAGYIVGLLAVAFLWTPFIWPHSDGTFNDLSWNTFLGAVIAGILFAAALMSGDRR